MKQTEIVGVENTLISDDWEVKKGREENYEH